MYIYIIILVVVIALWAILSFNGFIKLRNRTKEAWSDIDVQLKRRYDLIPNLIETVKGYASHEKEIFEKVVKARKEAMTAEKEGDPKKVEEAENNLSKTLKSLFAVSENYPDLKASNNFLELQRELRDTEDKIQASRRFYNNNVKSFNTKAESFPSNIIAKIFNFNKMDFFEVERPEQREQVNVKF